MPCTLSIERKNLNERKRNWKKENVRLHASGIPDRIAAWSNISDRYQLVAHGGKHFAEHTTALTSLNNELQTNAITVACCLLKMPSLALTTNRKRGRELIVTWIPTCLYLPCLVNVLDLRITGCFRLLSRKYHFSPALLEGNRNVIKIWSSFNANFTKLMGQYSCSLCVVIQRKTLVSLVFMSHNIWCGIVKTKCLNCIKQIQNQMMQDVLHWSRVFSRKMLGTRYWSVGTQFRWF